MLVGGRLEGLPRAKAIASARLCIPVTMSHPKANVKVGALSLNRPFEKGEAVEGKDLGKVLGTAVVPKQAEPGPAKYFKVDVTRYVKTVAGGARFNGFALKVLPDRNVDDGWTVRIDVPKEQEVYVELEVYTE